jgi:hypothetical protein
MRSIIILLSLFYISCFFGQNQSINALPTISLEDAIFNRDSIESIIDKISITPQRNFSLDVLKDN